MIQTLDEFAHAALQASAKWFDAPVAQLDRVPDYESDGCRFDSCRVHFSLIISDARVALMGRVATRQAMRVVCCALDEGRGETVILNHSIASYSIALRFLFSDQRAHHADIGIVQQGTAPA
jgi:hypothetical protein